MAADKEMPLIPFDIDYDKYLYVTELNDLDTAVKKQFTKKYVYYVGAYEGCGCGFSYGQYEVLDDDDQKQRESGKKSLEQLFNYIKTNIVGLKEIELFSCWAGNEESRPEYREIIELRKFKLGDAFYFKENQFIIIT